MVECFTKHCKHVLVVTSDIPGAGKTELIQSKAIKNRKRCVTIHISGPFNRMRIIEGLLQLELKINYYEFVSAGSTAYALSCEYIYIEIANSVKNELCDSLSTLTSFKREHLKWKEYDDLKVSIDINSPIQVVCRYLKELDKGLIDKKNLYFNGPDAVKPLSQLECKKILCQKFNTSVDMSYTLVNIFIRVLADQLKKLSSSVYFQTSTLKAITGGHKKSTVRSEIVKALVDLAGIFSIRSVHSCRKFQAAFLLRSGEKNLNVAKILADRVSGMIRWDEGNHLMILFNKDMQSISAIYRHLGKVPLFIKQLVESQTQTPLVSFDLKYNGTRKLAHSINEVVRYSDIQASC
ncbi:RNF213 [Mytilus edulis]|uniref:RNF213 n=1 Tax=Mytilus edulis TaxID=6550 RepID=A0A8S3RVE8_MYTED|nr:RNF213 [Mytilus edulis]